MKAAELENFINQLFLEIEHKIGGFKDSPDDWNISQGNVAMCIITEEGRIYGKLFGSQKLKQRQFFNVAWKKASQVWITGHKTGDYEKIVFGGTMDPESSPIELPDLIGWVGGQPIKVDEDTTLAIGFSGFRGFNDIGIVEQAVKKILKKLTKE
jgi:glc operon protein GlcG